MKLNNLCYLLALTVFISGCAGFGKQMKAMINSDDGVEQVEQKVEAPKPTRFSENQNLMVPQNKQYRRMTKSRMEEESELHSRAGSMWVMEGQGAYLFTQNKTRREGDLLNIKIEGPAQRQIETKVSVIKKLLSQLEEEKESSKKLNLADGAKPDATGRAPASAPAPVANNVSADKDDLGDLQAVPTRIVERLADGNYRVKGSQPFMIGKREYKVIVSGIVRPEDFNDEGMSANKILDAQYDVVSLRRSKE